MMYREKIVGYLEKFLLLVFSLFLILSPYYKQLGKRCFSLIIPTWLVINIFRYKQNFYRGLIPKNPLNNYFLYFGFACLFSIIFSFNSYHSQAIFFDRYIVYIFFFWIGAAFAVHSRKNLHALIYLLIFSSFIFGLGGAWDYFYYGCIGRMNPALVERLWSVFGRRIIYYGFPLYLTYFTPFVFFIFLFAKNKWLKFVCLINYVLLFLCLVWNASRAAWISMAISLLFISFMNKKKRIFTVVLSILILAIFLALFSFSSVTIKNRIETIILPAEWSFRLPLYSSAVSIFRDYPIFGIGIGMYEKVLHTPKYELPSDYPVPKELNLHAHNTYLEVAAEMGIVGLLTFLGIFVAFFIKGLKLIASTYRYNLSSEDDRAIFLGLMATILAILVFAFSTSIITVGVNNSAYFWLLLGMATALFPQVGLKPKENT